MEREKRKLSSHQRSHTAAEKRQHKLSPGKSLNKQANNNNKYPQRQEMRTKSCYSILCKMFSFQLNIVKHEKFTKVVNRNYLRGCSNAALKT